MHAFDASLVLQARQTDPPAPPKAFSGRADGRYRNAIGPFGGWTAALLLKSVLGMPEARGAPLALDAQFMGAIDDGEFEVRVSASRQNRSVGFWRSELWQAGRVCAQAQIALSMERASL